MTTNRYLNQVALLNDNNNKKKKMIYYSYLFDFNDIVLYTFLNAFKVGTDYSSISISATVSLFESRTAKSFTSSISVPRVTSLNTCAAGVSALLALLVASIDPKLAV